MAKTIQLPTLSTIPDGLSYLERYKGTNHGGKKETIATYALRLKRDPERVLVDMRAYMGRSPSSSVVTATVWVDLNDDGRSASGRAGGYGYCKESAALTDALISAGVSGIEDCHGAGVSAVKYAVESLARSCGIRGAMFWTR